jgi:hypothetical protein
VFQIAFNQSAAFKFLRTYFSDPKNILRETVAFNDSVKFAQLEMASPEYISGFSLHVRKFGEERTKKFALQLCTWTCIRTCIEVNVQWHALVDAYEHIRVIRADPVNVYANLRLHVHVHVYVGVHV